MNINNLFIYSISRTCSARFWKDWSTIVRLSTFSFLFKTKPFGNYNRKSRLSLHRKSILCMPQLRKSALPNNESTFYKYMLHFNNQPCERFFFIAMQFSYEVLSFLPTDTMQNRTLLFSQYNVVVMMGRALKSTGIEVKGESCF